MITTANRIKNIEEYYFSKKLAEVRTLDKLEFRVINLGIGSPDGMPSPATIEALMNSAKNPGNHGYQSYKGIPELRKSISDFYNRTYNVALDPDTMVLPLMGSKEGILHISLAFLNEDDVVLIPDPGYPTYSSVTRLTGAQIKYYPVKEELNWNIDVDELARWDLSNVKIMWINFPHMPTGSIADESLLKKLIDLAIKNNFLIVNDNPYSLIQNEKPVSILSIPGSEEVALELNSLSKSHNMAGWRLGWVAGKKEYVDAVLQVRSNMDSGMFLGIQHAAVEALKNGNDWFEKLNAMYTARKVMACKILDLLGCTYSKKQAGLFVWAKVPDSVPDVERWIDAILYKTKVFITPGFIFGESGRRYIRISLCATEEKFQEAMVRLRVWVQQNAIVENRTKFVTP